MVHRHELSTLTHITHTVRMMVAHLVFVALVLLTRWAQDVRHPVTFPTGADAGSSLHGLGTTEYTASYPFATL
jgi:hypothetical protein